ncbi:MAG: hypothetical protein MK101_06120 [Phycisphaerales bacterium]|nr:hypothetical protein [Phycisphaerales bacterium]
MQIAIAAAHVEARATVQWLFENSGHDVHAMTLSEAALACRSGGWDPANVPGLPVHRTQDINSDQSLQWLQSLRLDALVVLGWSQILGATALSVAPWAVGAHASPLPRGRGGSPVNWAIINRETRWGNTLMRLSSRLDGGDVIGQSLFPLGDQDTVASVYERVESSNLELVQCWLADLEAGRVDTRPQEPSAEPPFRRRCPDDGKIDWNCEAGQIDALIRATTRPYPGAWSTLRGTRLSVWSSQVCSMEADGGVVGQVAAIESRSGSRCPLVRCADRGLLLTDVTTVDGSELPANCFTKGDQLV